MGEVISQIEYMTYCDSVQNLCDICDTIFREAYKLLNHCISDSDIGTVTMDETPLKYRAPSDNSSDDPNSEVYGIKIPVEFGEEYTFKVIFSTVDLEVRSQGQSFRHKMISKETQKTCTALYTPTGNKLLPTPSELLDLQKSDLRLRSNLDRRRY